MTTTPTPIPPLAKRLGFLRSEMLEGRFDPRANLYSSIESAAASRCISWLQRELAPYDAEMARLRAERTKLRSRVAELLRDNRDSRAHSRRLRETIGEVVGVLEEGTVPVESEVAKMAAKVVAQNVKYRNLAGQALCMIADLEDEDFRKECMARLSKDSKALIEDAATLILRLAEMLQESTP